MKYRLIDRVREEKERKNMNELERVEGAKTEV